MSEITQEELELARARIRQWPREERRSLTQMGEQEVRRIALLIALLDLQPVDSDAEETQAETPDESEA